MKSYELNKKDNVKDSDFKLTLLLKTYFQSLSDHELTSICQDIVIKFNENKKLEKLKNLKKLILFKKQEDKKYLLKNFIDWRSKAYLIKFKDYALNCKQNHRNINEEDCKNEYLLNDSKINNSYMENSKKTRKI